MSDVVLPANEQDRPAAINLADGDKRRSDDTAWTRTTEYARELGYGDLTPRQERAITAATLEEHGLSWREAASLPRDYELRMLSPARVEAILERAGAERVFDPYAGDGRPGMPSSDSEDTVAVPPVVPPAAETELQHRTSRANETAEDIVLAGALLTAAGLAVWGAHEQRRRRDAERELKLRRADTVTLPVTAGTGHADTASGATTPPLALRVIKTVSSPTPASSDARTRSSSRPPEAELPAWALIRKLQRKAAARRGSKSRSADDGATPPPPVS